MISRTRMEAKKAIDDDRDVHPIFMLQHRHQVILTLVDGMRAMQLGKTIT